tara:strand:- start:368 stop:556 length:189 start_codon:yes stop_codon:yes gene_type:complete
MTKEIFIKIHNRLMGEYLEENPDADSAEVYNKTADLAGDEYVEYLETRADLARGIAQDDEWH